MFLLGISNFLRYSVKAYNFYLYPENELDARDFVSRVIFKKRNQYTNSLFIFRVHLYNFLLRIILILLNYFLKVSKFSFDYHDLIAYHFLFIGIPFIRQVIFLEKLKQQQELEARRQISNDQNILTNQHQKDLFNRRMSGFSQVIWYSKIFLIYLYYLFVFLGNYKNQ